MGRRLSLSLGGLGLGMRSRGGSLPPLTAPTLEILVDGTPATEGDEGSELDTIVQVEGIDALDAAESATTSGVELYLDDVKIADMTDEGGGTWQHVIAESGDALADGDAGAYFARRVTDRGEIDSEEVEFTVVQAPAAPTVTAPTDGLTIYVGQTVTLSATTTDGDLDSIKWYANPGGGETLLATDATDPYSQSYVVALSAGAHTLVARATRNGITTDSATIDVTVANPSTVSASLGVFSSANNFSVTGAGGPDLTASKTVVLLFEVSSFSGDQTIWCYADANSGWFLDFASAGDFRLFFRSAGGGSTNFQIRNPIRKGLIALAITRTSGGALRFSINGTAAAQLSASPTYTTALSTAENKIGRVQSGIGTFAAVGTRVLELAYIGAALSDADLQAATDGVNQLDRYFLPSVVRSHASLVSDMHATDYSGSGNLTAGHGSSPTTWTLAGTVTKNTIAAEIQHVITADEWWHDAGETTVAAQSSGPNYKMGRPFREFRFTTDATRLVFQAIADWSGLTNMNDFGVLVDGAVQGNNGSGTDTGINIDEFSIMRRLGLIGLAGSSKAIRVIDGPHSGTGGIASLTRRGICVQAVQYPLAASFTVSAPTPPSSRIVFVGDSIEGGQKATTSATYQAAAMLHRADYPGFPDSVTVEAYGFAAWWHICKDSTVRAAFVSLLSELCDGSSANAVWFSLGTNDYGSWSTLWGNDSNRADFRAAVGQLLDDIHTALPNLAIHLQTPLDRLNEGNDIGGSGVTLPEVRTDLGTVQSTRTGFVTLHDGTAALAAPPSSDFDSDGIHITAAAGMPNWKAWRKTELAY